MQSQRSCDAVKELSDELWKRGKYLNPGKLLGWRSNVPYGYIGS